MRSQHQRYGSKQQIRQVHPSSQMCSECGHINKEVKDLSVREWAHFVCGTRHCGDMSAAKNLASMLSAGREASEFIPVERALVVESKRVLRAITG